MIRMSKMTDYGIVLLAQMAASAAERLLNARDLAEASRLPMPTVSKVLKKLARAGLLESHRGAKGGYSLARPSEKISIAEVITLLEGPIAMTECNCESPNECSIERTCPTRSCWNAINDAVVSALEGISLKDMIEHRPGSGLTTAADAINPVRSLA